MQFTIKSKVVTVKACDGDTIKIIKSVPLPSCCRSAEKAARNWLKTNMPALEYISVGVPYTHTSTYVLDNDIVAELIKTDKLRVIYNSEEVSSADDV